MKKYLLGIGAIALACAILLVSVFRSAAVNYVFASTHLPAKQVLAAKTPDINYQLPYPGSILPDSPFWLLKALRDKVWYFLTTNDLKKAELALLFSDKRLVMSEMLFQRGKPDIAMSTLTKGEKYLEIAAQEEVKARNRGMDTSSFLIKMVNSSLKHRQLIEENLIPLAPEDAKPNIVKAEDYSKNAYKEGRDGLNSKGIEVPLSPFIGD